MIALYHSHPDVMEFDAEVLSCRPMDGQEGVYEVLLSNTAFYPTGGGQPCDIGTLSGCPVLDVTHEGDSAPILHYVRSAAPLCGRVHGAVDAARRLDHMQQHSGQHLLSHFLYEEFDAYSLGLHIGAADSYVDVIDNGRFCMTRELADGLEIKIAEWIARNDPVRCFFPTSEELAALPMRKKPDPHEELRIVCIGSEEAVACCGTHVQTTGQVQAVHILSWQQSHGNLRIFFVAGLRALRYAKVRMEQADAGAKLFSCNIAELSASIERLKAQNTELGRELADARKELVLSKLAAVSPIETALGRLYIACIDGATDAQLKDGIAALTRDDTALCFLCAPMRDGYIVAMGTGAASAVHAGDALRRVLTLLGGKGGGRKDNAFGRCPRMGLDQVRAALLDS